MIRSLTLMQQRVLSGIRKYIKIYGYAPSVREIGDMVGLKSTSSVSHQLRALELMGYIRRDRNVQRGMVLLAKADQ